MRRLLRGWLVAGLALWMPSALVAPAYADTVDWTEISLGKHGFGHLASPEEIVASVGADGVAFEDPGEGPGESPWSFDVAADGSIWLLDQFNYRLLVWEPGAPDEPSRTVSLPKDEIRIAADFSLGTDGTIYLSYLPMTPPDDRNRLMVCHLSATGEVLWSHTTDIQYFNSRLRTGPDGTVYWEGAIDTDEGTTSGTWTPVTTPDGEPLSLAKQRAGASPYQPMPGGLRFEEVESGEGSAHHWDFTLIDEADQTIGAWRLTSDDDLGGTIDEPGLVGGEPIVTVGIARQTQNDYLYEYVAIRLPMSGTDVEQISLDPDAVWGDVPITGIRVGPDGQVYQLRTDIDTGATIARYALGPVPTPTPTVTPSTPEPSASTPTVTPSTVTPPTAAPTVTALAEPPTRSSSGSSWWVIPAVLIVVASSGTGIWLLYRKRAAQSRN